MVVIDLLTSMVHLIPSRTDYKAVKISELMFETVYKLHGLPKNIINNQDVLFTSTFWQHLNKLVGTKQKMLSACHPQTDGSTAVLYSPPPVLLDSARSPSGLLGVTWTPNGLRVDY